MRLSCRRHLLPKRQFIYFRLVPCGMTRHHQKSRRLLRKTGGILRLFCARGGVALQSPYRLQSPIRVSRRFFGIIDRRVGVFCASLLPYCGWLVCCGLAIYNMKIQRPKRQRCFHKIDISLVLLGRGMVSFRPGMVSLQPCLICLRSGMVSSGPGMVSLRPCLVCLRSGMVSSRPGMVCLRPCLICLRSGMASLGLGMVCLRPCLLAVKRGLRLFCRSFCKID